MKRAGIGIAVSLVFLASIVPASAQKRRGDLAHDATVAMKRAATFYREEVATHGGYVYHYSLDLARRFGEGKATADQVWVQPPGTPTVGMAYLAAYEATGDLYYLEAARAAATALVYGQLESGGWTDAIDFDPKGSRVARYRNGKGGGGNNSSLSDDKSQSALRLLILVDRALKGKDSAIHRGARAGLNALLAAQFPNGAFPATWDGPSARQPIARARYPDYDWRSENRIREFWNLYALNDQVAGNVTRTLLVAWEHYQDQRSRRAIARLGDFLIRAQMPDPQPAWAQQYDYEMRPAWGRAYEPPAVTGGESQDAIRTLLEVYKLTGDEKYLAPIPKALVYLEASALDGGRLARFYELRTNKPLYVTARHELTYDAGQALDHYGWTVSSGLAQLSKDYGELKADRLRAIAREKAPTPTSAGLTQRVVELIGLLDERGRWTTKYGGNPIAGRPSFRTGEVIISSDVFARNLETLARYVANKKR